MIECLPTPNDEGCSAESCFPETARITAVAPGESGRAEFVVPRAEGIYVIRSTEGEGPTAQFMVQ